MYIFSPPHPQIHSTLDSVLMRLYAHMCMYYCMNPCKHTLSHNSAKTQTFTISNITEKKNTVMNHYLKRFRTVYMTLNLEITKSIKARYYVIFYIKTAK